MSGHEMAATIVGSVFFSTLASAGVFYFYTKGLFSETTSIDRRVARLEKNAQSLTLPGEPEFWDNKEKIARLETKIAELSDKTAIEVFDPVQAEKNEAAPIQHFEWPTKPIAVSEIIKKMCEALDLRFEYKHPTKGSVVVVKKKEKKEEEKDATDGSTAEG